MNTTNNEYINNQQQTRVSDTEIVHKPFVQEQDFPEKSSRLQDLIAKYRKNQNIPAPVKPTNPANPLDKVNVKPGVKVKTFDNLEPDEQQKVMARIDGIDYTVSINILNFGSAKESTMTKHAEKIISKYSAHEIDELTDPLTTLVASLKSSNPSSIVKGIGGKKQSNGDKEWGLLESIIELFAMKRVQKKMYKALAKRESIKLNLKELQIELEKNRLSLQLDIESYEQMKLATFDQVSEFGLDCVALNLMMEDAQAKLNLMLGDKIVNEDGSVSAPELDPEELYKAQGLQNSIERMLRRMHAIASVRVSTLQTIPMLDTLITGDEIICEKIDEIITLVIPMWSWQYAIAIGAIKQQKALSLVKTIRGATSQLLTGNAKMLHDNMVAAYEEFYSAIVNIEDLRIVQDFIENMVTTVQAKSKKSSSKILEDMQTMQQIDQRNYDLLS